MPLFRRRRRKNAGRVDVGRYQAPRQFTLAPIERVVEEGALIATSSVRMAVKNRVIVAALRDDSRFDSEMLVSFARRRMRAIAQENEQTADRLLAPAEPVSGAPAGAIEIDSEAILDEEHRRRPTVHRMLASRLRQQADDVELASTIVEEARDDAWQEVAREIGRQLDKRAYSPDREPDYESERAERMRQLVAVDLVQLRREQRWARIDAAVDDAHAAGRVT
ncbi:hypothetical protein OSC27_06325 [Microbacterium sp. STN6]|uniref:hypothetical protein n=1 Tax=Microbacterium sp. STN6 TaxID=2995588 RepID=UPI002260C691|nr:hypothetical protein [Microbacterium sp. STN6]MCX7521894.1 hypothetical protein [Microbacterium sp. STN6]